MVKQQEIEEVKKLIESGFNLDLISFELDIPIELLKQYKLDMEKGKINNSATRMVHDEKNIIEKRNNHAHSKISKMREKYKQLYFESNTVNDNQLIFLSQKNLEEIRTVIVTVQETIKKMQTLSKNEKRKLACNILTELKKIDEYPLPITEAEQIYELMCSKELQGLNSNTADRINYFIKKQKSKCAYQFTKAIECEQYNVDDMEGLLNLKRKLTKNIVDENPLAIGAVENRISKRIEAMRQQQAIDRIKNDISPSIISIIHDLVNGNIDTQKANSIIDDEAKRRAESKQKNRFSLTEEQEKRQILIQIRMAITERADKFNIKDPEKAVLQIQELCGGKLEQSIRTVVKNLIAQKDYETAKNICDKFSEKNKNDVKEFEHAKYIRGLKNEIRNAEISDYVMTAINMNGTVEEESAYFELLEKGIKMGNFKLSEISLGKSRDGLKSITLADIWTNENEKGKSR